MGMAVNDRIETFRKFRIGNFPEKPRILLVMAGRGSEVFTGGGRGYFRDSACQVRMNQPKKRDGQPVAEHPLEHAISMIARIESIAVVNEEPFPLVFDNAFIRIERQPHIVPQILAEPVIVVTRQKRDFRSGADEVIEFEDNRGCGAWNHGAVFEPEVEQVAGNIEVGSMSPEFTEEGRELLSPLGIVPGEAEMGVGDKHDTVGRLLGWNLHMLNIRVCKGIFQYRIQVCFVYDN
jgi:hypothetical protein